MKRFSKASVLLSLILVLTSYVGGGLQASASDIGVTVIKRDIPYCPCEPDITMDIYFRSVSRTPVPAIIYVHGGGWYSGDKQDPECQAFIRPLVDRGYLVAAVNYRLAPRYQFPAQLQDIKYAIRFLRANAADYNIDPDSIGAIGDSAGGHLVALLGLTANQDNIPDQLTDSVQAVVDLYGPTDLTVSFENESLLLLDHVFGTDDRSSETLKRASPVTYVSSKAPPFLIIQGEEDDTVMPEQSQKLFDELKLAGAEVDLIMVQNAGHAFSSSEGNICPDRNQIMDSIIAFFNENLDRPNKW